MPAHKATCLVAMAITCSSAPGHATSYVESNLHHHGGGGAWGVHDHHHHPKYHLEDHHTGDQKEAKEKRDGDMSMVNSLSSKPDGRQRIVHHTANHHGGFNAHITYSGLTIHPHHHHR